MSTNVRINFLFDYLQYTNNEPNILQQKLYNSICRFNGLDKPLQLRKEDLDESLRFHKFGFELEAELGWIREHLPLVESIELGSNLHQVQTLYKKHKKLEAEIQGHQPMINKTLESGQALIHQKHPETKQVIQSIINRIVTYLLLSLGKIINIYFSGFVLMHWP